MRWMQLAFVEATTPAITIRYFWLDYFRRVHADAACLSAGGCVAFYPTKVPFHYRSKYLGGGDAFGEMVAGCRKLGMNVVARTIPTQLIKTFTTPIRNGSPSMKRGKSGGIGPTLSCG